LRDDPIPSPALTGTKKGRSNSPGLFHFIPYENSKYSFCIIIYQKLGVVNLYAQLFHNRLQPDQNRIRSPNPFSNPIYSAASMLIFKEGTVKHHPETSEPHTPSASELIRPIPSRIWAGTASTHGAAAVPALIIKPVEIKAPAITIQTLRLQTVTIAMRNPPNG
jgi:hypothetical protein